MIKLIAMLIAYKYALRSARSEFMLEMKNPEEVFEERYKWMYDTLTKPIFGKPEIEPEGKLEVIASEIQSWLDYQEKQYRQENILLSDDSHLYAPPVWPTRGVLEEWVKVLREEK